MRRKVFVQLLYKYTLPPQGGEPEPYGENMSYTSVQGWLWPAEWLVQETPQAKEGLSV